MTNADAAYPQSAHPDQPLADDTASPAARRAGLRHTRRRIRRRASWLPLLFLVAVGAVVLGTAVLRPSDELAAIASIEFANADGRTHVTASVSMRNFDDDPAVVLSVGANASGPIVGLEAVVTTGAGQSSVADEPSFVGLQTATIDLTFSFSCIENDDFAIDVVIRVQLRQNGFHRVFEEPDYRNGPRAQFRCEEGRTVLVDAGAESVVERMTSAG